MEMRVITGGVEKRWGRQEETEQNGSIFEMCKFTEWDSGAPEQQVAMAERGN
jgi:hypothetical protein